MYEKETNPMVYLCDVLIQIIHVGTKAECFIIFHFQILVA